jgi:aldehyde dehydrogenase (NAD+)
VTRHDQLVSDLRRTFDTGRTRPLAWRKAQLDALLRLLTEQEERLVAAVVSDHRRTHAEAWLGDVLAVRGEIKHVQRNLHKWMRPVRAAVPATLKPGRAWSEFEPRGVVLVIGPWNYPIHLLLVPLVDAIAAGNCVVLKPSEHAQACSALIAELIPRYLDPEAFAVVEGDAAVSESLIDCGFDYCFFTGSPEVGKSVMAAAARHLTPVTLELGGKCPVVVAADANLDVAAKRIAWAKLMGSGQTCVAPDYVLADRRTMPALVEKLAAAMTELAPSPMMPIVNQRHTERLEHLINTSGGRTALGGTADATACSVAPTIIVEPSAGAPIGTEEIFGPVLAVYAVDSVAEAVSAIASRSKPLATYLFTSDRGVEATIRSGVSSGGIVVNQLMQHLGVPELPFGGVGRSGIGSYHGRFGFETFSHRKAILRRTVWPEFKFAYPPFSPRMEKLIRRLS